jgi:hypothetical protein
MNIGLAVEVPVCHFSDVQLRNAASDFFTLGMFMIASKDRATFVVTVQLKMPRNKSDVYPG